MVYLAMIIVICTGIVKFPLFSWITYIEWLFRVYDLLFLQVNVSISSRDSYCIDVVLRCLAIAGDGLETHELNDGGILGTILASGFKGRNFIK